MRIRWLAALALCSFSGCGADRPAGPRPPAARIRGTLTARTRPTAPLHVALVWLGVSLDRGAFQVAQDVAVRDSLPATYELDLDVSPPAEAIDGFLTDEARQDAAAAGLDPDLAWAQGVVLVYEDGNGNGQLDLVGPGETSPDHVVGKAEGVTVWFVGQGTPAPLDYLGALPVAGAVSVTRAPLVDPPLGACAYDDAQGHYDFPCSQAYAPDRALLPLPATVDIEMTSDPHLDHYSCRSFWGSDEWPDWASDWNQWSPLATGLCSGPGCDCDGYACPLDLPPAGVEVRCNAEGTAYAYKTCVEDPDVCGTRFCHYGHGERAALAPPPDGWPCPAQARR